MARQRPRTTTALAALLLAVVGVAGAPQTASESTASSERTGNAALRPPEMPYTPSLERAAEMLNKTADSLSLVDPFVFTPTPTATAEEERAPTSTPTPTPTPTSHTETPEPTIDASTAESLDALEELDDIHAGSGSMEAHRRSVGRKVGPASAPAPSDVEEPSDGGPETSSTVKRTNVIAFDVVTPQSVNDDEETKSEETSRPPAPSPAAAAPAPTTPASTKPLPPAPSSLAPPGAAPQPSSSQPTPPAAPGAVPSSIPPAAVPAASVPPGASASTSLEPRSTSVAPGQAKPATAVLGDSVPSNSKGQASHSSSSSAHEPTVEEPERSKKDAAGSGSASTSTETSTTSESSYYSMGTASILSIVGVIVGICVIIGLFVLISRREYEDDDDDRDVLGYGGDGGFKIGDRPTIVRLSPTFLMNGAGQGAPGQPMEPDFSLPSPLQIMGSNRGGGPTGSNRGGAAIGSSRGYAPTGAVPEESPAILESSLPPRRRPSNGDRATSSDSGAAFQHSDDISTLDSRGSDGWSSVMESEFDMRSASRCTRDTTFSNITMSQNLSELNAWDLTSQHHRTGSGRTGSRRTGGSRGTRSAPMMPEYDLDEEEDDASSVVSYDIDESHGKGARSTGFSSYRSSAESQFSDYRSTTGFGASRS